MAYSQLSPLTVDTVVCVCVLMCTVTSMTQGSTRVRGPRVVWCLRDLPGARGAWLQGSGLQQSMENMKNQHISAPSRSIPATPLQTSATELELPEAQTP